MYKMPNYKSESLPHTLFDNFCFSHKMVHKKHVAFHEAYFFNSFTIFYFMNVPSVEDVGFALNLFPSHCSKVICGGLGGDCFYYYF